MVVVYGLLVGPERPFCQQKVSAPGARDPVIVGDTLICAFYQFSGHRWSSCRSPLRACRRQTRECEETRGVRDFGGAEGLWREAIYRWEQAAKIDPNYSAAYNDLAIAYEHEGQLDKARKAYEKALEIEPNNSQIQQNYDLFKEINDRTNRRGSR
jgi:cytochrome c-type biogenesis protein CcmH/NrfG